MKFKGVIFDLDGTLVNSIEDLADSMNRVLLNHHFPTHSIDAYKTFLGKGILNLVHVSIPETDQDEQTVNTCFTQMIDTYRNNCTIKTKPYDGIIDLLDELKSRKIKLNVLSNKADKFTKEIVQKLLPDYFDIVTGLTTEETKKPNPKIALQMSTKMGINTENILFIGDTGIDMQTSSNANMHGVGVLWGFREKEELINSGAKSIISHPMELINLI